MFSNLFEEGAIDQYFFVGKDPHGIVERLKKLYVRNLTRVKPKQKIPCASS